MNVTLSSDLRTLLSYWDANAYSPEDAPDYLRNCSAEEVAAIRAEVSALIDAPKLQKIMQMVTVSEFRTDEQARQFLRKVEEYLFDGGDMPDT